MEGLSIFVLTIFPGMIESFLRYGIIKRALERQRVSLSVVNIRESAIDRHKTVDDTPYGGGAGMIMKPDVLAASLKSLPPIAGGRHPHVILLTPQGQRFDQTIANRLSLMDEFVLVCGRYRGIDERFCERYVDEELSIGDFVLSGGEAAALVVIDAVVRLVPGVLGDFESGIEDSFQDGLLDCPWYTRPETFEGMKVPDILLSGNHAEIQKWREGQALDRTRSKRPDLMEK